jgi:hypothetical protein
LNISANLANISKFSGRSSPTNHQNKEKSHPMIPSKRWFPTTLNERVAWINSFAKNFEKVGPSLGFSAADITSMTQDAEDFKAAANALNLAEAFMAGLRLYRITITEAKSGSPEPHFPTLNISPPPNGVPAGIFQRLDERVQRIRTAATYTDEVGALLGIIPARRQSLVESELVPQLKASALPGNVVQLRFTRAETDGLFVQIKLHKEGEWTNVGRFMRSPAVIEVPDGSGDPRAVQIRARYMIGNDSVGQNSNIIDIVTTP